MTIITDSEKVLVLTSSESTLLVRSATTGVVISQETRSLIIPSEEVKTIYIGSPGPQGPSGQIGQVQFNTVAQAGNTIIADSLSTSLFDGVKWILIARDDTTDSRIYMEIAATHSSGAAIDAIGPILGDLSILNDDDVQVVVQSGNLNLTISNNYTQDLTIQVARIKLDKFVL